MLRSLSSGVSGLKAHQTQMDVIGNNIANVNTAAFKSSRVTFKDVYYQTLSGASGSSDTNGGSNPTQIGYGSAVSTIDVVNTRGGKQTTDRALDVYISGDGYFVMTNADASEKIYTRAGNFGFDEKGGLVDSNGNYVLDAEKKSAIIYDTINELTDISIASDGTISGIDSAGVSQTIGQIAVAKFKNPDGLSQQDGVYYLATKNSGDEPIITFPGDQSTGTLVSGGLEMSNVDLSTELTSMITAERGFQANSRVITVSDEMLQELVNLKR